MEWPKAHGKEFKEICGALWRWDFRAGGGGAAGTGSHLEGWHHPDDIHGQPHQGCDSGDGQK